MFCPRECRVWCALFHGLWAALVGAFAWVAPVSHAVAAERVVPAPCRQVPPRTCQIASAMARGVNLDGMLDAPREGHRGRKAGSQFCECDCWQFSDCADARPLGLRTATLWKFES